MRIRRRRIRGIRRKRYKLNKKCKLKRGRGFWSNLQKGLDNSLGYSGYSGFY